MVRSLQVWFNVAAAQLGTPLGLTARRRGWRHVLVALVTTAAALADGGFKNGSMREGSKGQSLFASERKKERKKEKGWCCDERALVASCQGALGAQNSCAPHGGCVGLRRPECGSWVAKEQK